MRQTRRQFAHRAGLGLAALAFADAPALAAARPLRVAVLGHTGRGDYGHGLDRVWKDIDGVELVAVADPDERGRDAAAKRLGVHTAYADHRILLEKERPDIVSVAPRFVDRHEELTVAAARSGASVFLEKPMCRDLLEADRISNAVKESGVRLAIAHQTRYSPRLRTVRDLIARGEIGELMELRGRGKEDRRGGGEDLWVLGTHVFDLMRAIAGDARWCFARVTENGDAVRAEHVRDGNEGIGPLAGDRVEALFGFDHGVTGSFSSHRNRAANPSRFGLTIHGSKGVIEIGTGYLPPVHLLRDPSWSPGRTRSTWIEVSSAGVGEPEPLVDTGLHGGNLLIARDLIESIQEDREPLGGLEHAVAATEMICAVFRSQVEGARVALPSTRRGHPLREL